MTRRQLLPLGLLLLAGTAPLPAEDVDLDAASALSETLVSALEAGQAAQGLTLARQLRTLLAGEDPGGPVEGLAILRRQERLIRLYELSADAPDAAVIQATRQAWRTFRSGVPGQELRYPNGQRAVYRFGQAQEWFFPNGRRIAYRATATQEWKYANGQRMAYRPTTSQEWRYPNRQRVAYRPTSSQEWKYANGQRIAYRPTNSREWHYPNGRRICYRLGRPNQVWYYPDGTRWTSAGPTYSNDELEDVPRVITRILEDSGWADGRGRGPAAPAGSPAAPGDSPSPAALELRRLEAELPDRLRFDRHRPLAGGELGEFLDRAGEGLGCEVYQEEAGSRAVLRGAGEVLELRLDEGGRLDWESAELRPLL